MSNTTRRPNRRLRHEREARGWSQAYVARQLGADANIVSCWESGERKPGPYYHQKLCALFGKSAVELGLLEADPEPATTSTLPTALSNQSAISASAIREPLQVSAQQLPPLFVSMQTNDLTPDQYAGFLLAHSATNLATLLQEGWPRETLLQALQVVLQGASAMSRITRRTFVELSLASMLGGVPLPTGERLSAEERMQLHQGLGKSIASGWKLFTTKSISQVLLVGQALLYILQQAHTELYPAIRPLFYSPVYRLIGAALFFQARYTESMQAHTQAYLAALEGADAWNMAESLSWQAGILKACGRQTESIQATESALRLLQDCSDPPILAARARFLAHWAESAALLQ